MKTYKRKQTDSLLFVVCCLCMFAVMWLCYYVVLVWLYVMLLCCYVVSCFLFAVICCCLSLFAVVCCRLLFVLVLVLLVVRLLLYWLVLFTSPFCSSQTRHHHVRRIFDLINTVMIIKGGEQISSLLERRFQSNAPWICLLDVPGLYFEFPDVHLFLTKGICYFKDSVVT